MFYIYADGELLSYPLIDDLTVLNPKLTLERGKAGSLSFDLPPTNQRYADLKKLRTVVTVEYDDTEIFRGRVLSEEKNFNNVKSIYCEGDLAYLVDSVQKGERFEGTARELFQKVLDAHNAMMDPQKRFLMGSVTVKDCPVLISGQSDEIEDAETNRFDYKQIAINATTNDWENSFDYLSNNLIEYAGGYLRTRRADGVTYLDYLAEDDAVADQTIEFGVNMLDLTQEISAEDLFTVLIPLGDENLTLQDMPAFTSGGKRPYTHAAGSMELVDVELAAMYGRIIRTHAFDGVTSGQTLLENGIRYLENNASVPITLSVKAVDLNLVNPDIREIHLGEIVHVKSSPHGIIEDVACAKIEYDLANPANTVYTFGTPKQTLTQRYRKDAKKDNAANRTGGAGGAGKSGDVAEEQINEIKSWINYNPDIPVVDIGTLSKKVETAETVLRTECGIDINGEAGGSEEPNINLRFLQSRLSATESNLDGTQAALEVCDSNIKMNADGLKLSTERIVGLEKGYAEIETTVAQVESRLQSQINLKADQVNIQAKIDGVYQDIASFGQDITTINSRMTTINSQITSMKKLIAEEIESGSAVIAALKSKSLTVDNLYANNYVSSPAIRMGGYTVATQSWVNMQNYQKVGDISWGNVTNGFIWLNLNGVSKRMAMANHTHSAYLTSLPNHTHHFTASATLVWGHTHANSGAGGVNNYAPKTITISGNTGAPN